MPERSSAPGGVPGVPPTSSRPLRVAARLVPTAVAFIRAEAAGGLVLLAALGVALAWANSAAGGSYGDFWHTEVTYRALRLDTDLVHIVNDGLMTLFFYVVGLEIKRELVEGELASPRQAALPVIAAIGGMAGPALIYLAINAGGDGARGWGIPMATDIALAAGVLALLGDRVPASLKVFLLALAIVDDVGGIVVIAVFYSSGLSWLAMLAAGALLALLLGMRLARIHSGMAFLVIGMGFWAAVLVSGVHPTIAGVVLAMLTSAGTRDDPGDSPLDRAESLLHPWASLVVVPVFALANGGVELTRDAVETAWGAPVAAGIFMGLVLGKPLGILLASAIAVRVGVAVLPEDVRWPHVAGAGALGGIGFTVSLFIAGLAFEDTGVRDEARISILAASVAAGLVGYFALWLVGRQAAPSGSVT